MTVLATYGELLKDYRAVLSRLQPGDLELIETRYQDGSRTRRIWVFDVLIWDDEVDEGKEVIKVSGRAMKDNPAFHPNVARDLLVNLKISAARGKHYLIEPRRGSLLLVALRLGLSDRTALERAALGGGLRHLVADDREALIERHKRRTKKLLRSERASAEARQAALGVRLAEVDAERMTLKHQLGQSLDTENILRARDDELRVAKARIGELRNFILVQGLQPPFPGSSGGSGILVTPGD